MLLLHVPADQKCGEEAAALGTGIRQRGAGWNSPVSKSLSRPRTCNGRQKNSKKCFQKLCQLNYFAVSEGYVIVQAHRGRKL